MTGTTPAGERIHRITLQNPGPPVPDSSGEGTTIPSWVDLDPRFVDAKIVPATVRDLERLAAGTAIASASHIVTMPYHPQVTTQTRIDFNGRTLYVKGVTNPEERNVETIAVCQELVP